MELTTLSSVLAVIGYTLATLAVVLRLFHPKGPNLILILSLACAAIVGHSMQVSGFLLNSQAVNFNLPNVVSLVSLLITMLITLTALKYKVNLLLPVSYGFAAVWQLVVLVIPPIDTISLSADTLALVSHITLALIAYCVLVIATLYAFQVTYINLKLKSKNLAAVNHLPPLMQVENQLFIILALGTVCLLASQVTGLLFLDNFFAKAQLHKTVLSLSALVVYGAILWGHYSQGWRGHRVLVLTLIGTGLLTLSYFGSRFVKEFLLS